MTHLKNDYNYECNPPIVEWMGAYYDIDIDNPKTESEIKKCLYDLIADYVDKKYTPLGNYHITTYDYHTSRDGTRWVIRFAVSNEDSTTTHPDTTPNGDVSH